MKTFKLACSVACSAIALVVLALPVRAQQADTGGPQDGQTQPITFTDSVERSFNIEPVVHRFQGRRGEIIPFSFQITSTGKPLNLSIMLVSLRQEESGIIMHDVHTPPPQQIRFTTETSFSLAPGQSRTLAGEITVPISKTNYLSYGVLVRDQGSINELTNQNSSNDTSTRASVKFVTQYLLRVDIETRGSELGELQQMKMVDGIVKSINGMPIAEAYLENPTDMALECTVRGEINSPNLVRAKPFYLGLQSRAGLSGNDRHLVRLMPHSRVRLSAPIDDLLLPGEQILNLDLMFQQRRLIEQSFTFEVNPGQFPALETQTAHLANRLAAEPAQIELGLTRGARRTLALRLMNNSDVEQTLVLEPRDLNGQITEKVKLSSDSVTLAPGRYKNVRVTLGNSNETSAAYGVVAVLSQAGQTIQSAGEIPLALFFAEPSPPQITLAPMQALASGDGTGFRVTVHNRGVGYVPIDAELRISSLSGGSLVMADGFGKWLAPGQDRHLDFVPEKRLPDGEYQLSLFVRTTPDAPVSTSTLNIKLPLEQAADETLAKTEKSIEKT